MTRGVSDHTRKQLIRLKPLLQKNLQAVLDVFYAALMKDPEAHEVLSDPELLSKARCGQQVHWIDWVFSGRFTDDYYARCRAIGIAHQKHGISPDVYMRGYRVFLQEVSRLILESADVAAGDKLSALQAVQEAVFLDAGLALTVYCAEDTDAWRRKAEVDPLTGLKTRGAFLEIAQQIFLQAQRYSRVLSMAMVDLDHFKDINDTHGHAVGDAVLQAVGQCLGDVVRSTDVVGRWGGEEFLILMPETALAQTERLGERLRLALAEMPIATRAGTLRMTASIGIAEMKPGDAAVDGLIERADKAMYAAKEQGRNRVVCL